MWVSRQRAWVPMARATVLVAASVAAFLAAGWVTPAIFGGWAVLDGAGTLGSACRCYDEGEPWTFPLVEGLTQLLLGAFVWLWWGIGSTPFAWAIGLVVLTGALAVLASGLADIWHGDRDGRIAPGATAAAVFFAVTLVGGLGPSAERTMAAVLSYVVVFVLTAGARSMRLSGRAAAAPQALRSASVWSSMQYRASGLASNRAAPMSAPQASQRP
jgi:hypothetical protein